MNASVEVYNFFAKRIFNSVNILHESFVGIF